MEAPNRAEDPKRHWAKRLNESLPEFLENHPVLRRFYGNAGIVLHGSTTLGIDDSFSDLDVWILMEESDLARLDAISETRFFDRNRTEEINRPLTPKFKLDGKIFHLNAESIEDFSNRIKKCDIPLIFELRNAACILDNLGTTEHLIAHARKPMREDVSLAFFFHHYVEMRGYHRDCDNPMERGDPLAVLFSLSVVLTHAHRAAMILDAEPYPYQKWLHYAAIRTPTGNRVTKRAERILDLLVDDYLRFEGPERDNAISHELRHIRGILIEAAHIPRVYRRLGWISGGFT